MTSETKSMAHRILAKCRWGRDTNLFPFCEMALQMDVHKWNETGKRCKEYMKLTDARSHRLELLSIFAESQYLQFLSQLFALLWVYLAATRLCNPVTLERQAMQSTM